MPVTLVVSAGQSNEVGYRVTADQLPAYVTAINPHVFRFDPATGGKVVLRAGVNTGTDRQPGAVGPEVAFAYGWSLAHPGEDLVFVKIAKGSTGLAADPRELDWSPRSRGELFDQATAAVRQAKAALGVRVSGILWMQGEQDATVAAKAADYRENLSAMFRQMRLDWGDSGTPIVFGRISDKSRLAYGAIVRAAQDEVGRSDERAIEVATDSFAMQADRLHYSGAGQLSLGLAFHEAWRQAPQSLAGMTP
ncbi:MAG TPA: sialate O-acetylesterase [Phenylobacterium sp.]|nr:sialate O-acetylesterase [Phenylobacterium sp.]